MTPRHFALPSSISPISMKNVRVLMQCMSKSRDPTHTIPKVISYNRRCELWLSISPNECIPVPPPPSLCPHLLLPILLGEAGTHDAPPVKVRPGLSACGGCGAAVAYCLEHSNQLLALSPVLLTQPPLSAYYIWYICFELSVTVQTKSLPLTSRTTE